MTTSRPPDNELRRDSFLAIMAAVLQEGLR